MKAAERDPMMLDSMGAFRSLTRMEPLDTPPTAAHATKQFISDDILADRSTGEEPFVPSPRSGTINRSQISMVVPPSAPRESDSASSFPEDVKVQQKTNHRILRLKPPRYAGLVPLPLKPFGARCARTAKKEIEHRKWWVLTQQDSSPSQRVYVIPDGAEAKFFDDVDGDKNELPTSAKARRSMRHHEKGDAAQGPTTIIKPTVQSLFGQGVTTSEDKFKRQKAKWAHLFPKLAAESCKFSLRRLLFGSKDTKPLYPLDAEAPDTFLGAFDGWTIHNGGRQWVHIFITTNHICMSTATGDVRDEVHFSNILSLRQCVVVEESEGRGEEPMSNIIFNTGYTSTTNSPSAARARKVFVGASPQATLSVKDFELTVAAMNLRQGDHTNPRRPQYDDIPSFIPIDEGKSQNAQPQPVDIIPIFPATDLPLKPAAAHIDPLAMYSPLMKSNKVRPAAGEFLAHATEASVNRKGLKASQLQQHNRIPSSPPMGTVLDSAEPVMTSTTLRGLPEDDVEGEQDGDGGEVAQDFQIEASPVDKSPTERGSHPIPFEQRPSYAANLKMQALLLSIMKDNDGGDQSTSTGSPSEAPSRSSPTPTKSKAQVPPAPAPPPPPATAIQMFTRTGIVYHFWGLMDLTTNPAPCGSGVAIAHPAQSPPSSVTNSTPDCSMCSRLGICKRPTECDSPSAKRTKGSTPSSTEPASFRTPITSDLSPVTIGHSMALDDPPQTVSKVGEAVTCPRCGTIGTKQATSPAAVSNSNMSPSPTLLHIRHRHQQFESFDRLVDTTWRVSAARLAGIEVQPVRIDCEPQAETKKATKKAPALDPCQALLGYACSPQLLFVNMLRMKIEYETPDGSVFTLENKSRCNSRASSVSSRAALGGSLGGSLTTVDRLLNRSAGVDGDSFKTASQTNRSALLSKMSFDQTSKASPSSSLGTSMLMSSSTARGSSNRRQRINDSMQGGVVKLRGQNKSISTGSIGAHPRSSITEPLSH